MVPITTRPSATAFANHVLRITAPPILERVVEDARDAARSYNLSLRLREGNR